MFVMLLILFVIFSFAIGYRIGLTNKSNEIEAKRNILTKIIYVNEERSEIKALQDAGYKIIDIEPFNKVCSKIDGDIYHYTWTRELVTYEKI